MDKTASLHSINLKKLPLFESDSEDLIHIRETLQQAIIDLL